MKEILQTLIHEAILQKVVATQRLEDGLILLAYPLSDGVIVALGALAERIPSPREVLRKRSEDLERYGHWLPAMFNDGSLYVLRRLRSDDDQASVLDDAALAIAEELLN
jgi:hypothetical protein